MPSTQNPITTLNVAKHTSNSSIIYIRMCNIGTYLPPDTNRWVHKSIIDTCIC